MSCLYQYPLSSHTLALFAVTLLGFNHSLHAKKDTILLNGIGLIQRDGSFTGLGGGTKGLPVWGVLYRPHSGSKLSVRQGAPVVQLIRGINNMSYVDLRYFSEARLCFLAPSSSRRTHIIKHCNDLFSACFTASLWMKFTKKCGVHKIWQDKSEGLHIPALSKSQRVKRWSYLFDLCLLDFLQGDSDLLRLQFGSLLLLDEHTGVC